MSRFISYAILMSLVSMALGGCAGTSFVSKQEMNNIIPNSTLEMVDIDRRTVGTKGPLYFSPDGKIISRHHGSGYYKIDDENVLTVDWPSKVSGSSEVYFKLHSIGNGEYLPCWKENVDDCHRDTFWKFTKGDVNKLR